MHVWVRLCGVVLWWFLRETEVERRSAFVTRLNERRRRKSLSLWPSGIGSRLGRNRLWLRFLAASDIYDPMSIEPTITWVPRGFLGTYGGDRSADRDRRLPELNCILCDRRRLRNRPIGNPLSIHVPSKAWPAIWRIVGPSLEPNIMVD